MPFDPLGSGTIMRPVLTDATQAQKCSMPITLRQLLPVHLVFLFMNLDSGGPQGHVKGESISREEARNCNSRITVILFMLGFAYFPTWRFSRSRLVCCVRPFINSTEHRGQRNIWSLNPCFQFCHRIFRIGLAN